MGKFQVNEELVRKLADLLQELDLLAGAQGSVVR